VDAFGTTHRFNYQGRTGGDEEDEDEDEDEDEESDFDASDVGWERDSASSSAEFYDEDDDGGGDRLYQGPAAYVESEFAYTRRDYGHEFSAMGGGPVAAASSFGRHALPSDAELEAQPPERMPEDPDFHRVMGSTSPVSDAKFATMQNEMALMEVAKFRREVALELVSQAVYTDRAIKQAIELLKERHRGMISPEDMDAVAAGLKRELGLS